MKKTRRKGEKEMEYRNNKASKTPNVRFIHCGSEVEAEFLNSGYLPPGVRDQVSVPIFNHLMIEILIWWMH